MGLKTRKAAEVAAKQQVNVEADARKHLLVKMGADRNVREAYLHGLVFAGLANDDDEPEIQSEERSVLDEICVSLEIEVSLINEIVAAEKASIDDDTYKDLLRECLVLFSDIKMYDAFLEDFDKVWSVGKGNPAELKSWHNDFEEMVSADVAVVLKERKRISALNKKREREEKVLAERDKMRADFDAWLDEIADEYDLKKIPAGVPARLSRQANRFDVNKLDLDAIKKGIVAQCKTSQCRMAWKLLGYFALRFKLTDNCHQTRSVEYLIKTVFGKDSSIWGSGFSGKDVKQAFKDCIAKYDD